MSLLEFFTGDFLDPLLMYCEEQLYNCREKLIVSKDTHSMISLYDISDGRKNYNIYRNTLKTLRYNVVNHIEKIKDIQIKFIMTYPYPYRQANINSLFLTNHFQSIYDELGISFILNDIKTKLSEIKLDKELKKIINKKLRMKIFLINYIKDYEFLNGNNIGFMCEYNGLIENIIRKYRSDNSVDELINSVNSKRDYTLTIMNEILKSF
tara:strand:- start:4921 stop:5547 length:627 start_codon:yes stop_codon:yes gene_type:complete